METYFSVGEISKLTNVPIQTLIYYDKMGLLKPAYINEQNNYRYYSVNQFIKIDLLKQCKVIGLSLKEIEELLKNEISVDSMLKLIDQQRKVLDNKIQELESVKSYINFLGDRLKETKKIEENKIFITSQNHGYYVSEMPENMEVTHINLNDNTVEGMRRKELPIYSVQYHPEACPGPKDNDYIFDKFLELV